MPIASSQKKKSLKLLVLGEEAHGKTTFTAALSKILAVKSVNKATPLDEIEDTDAQKIKTSDGDKIQVNFSKVDIESDKLNLMLYDFPTHNEFMDFIQNTQESIDGVILVVDAVECSGENTKEQLKAVSAKLKDTKNMIVFLNKVDLTEDKDQIDLAELTTKDMLTGLNITPDSIPFYRGSASAVIDSNDRKSSKPFVDFMKGVNKLPSH